jgi:hypothetical protein
MLASRTFRRWLVIVLGALGAVASIAPVASAAQRYASPTGSGPEPCSSASPCSIKQAVEHAGGGDEVIVTPGDYPLTTTLATPYGITIRGVAGQPRPRLLFSGTGQGGQSQEGLKVMYGSTLRYVEVDQAPGNDWPAFTAVNSAVDQVIAKGQATGARILSSVIRNSIAVASSDFGVALRTEANGANVVGTYRNVTAIATGNGGTAIRATAQSGSVNVLARNVIARGGPGGPSIFATADPGTTATITVDHSNRPDASTIGAGASIVDGGGNQSAPPVFVNAAAGDYHQAAGSPTINEGLNEFVDGPFDLDGDPRQLFGIDIGADEFVVGPTASTGAASAVTHRSATVSGSVDANGAPTSYRFDYGPTTAYGSATSTADAGSGGTVPAAATLDGLSSSTTYHYRLVATNAGGLSKGADQTFTTAPPPPSSTSTASSETTSTSTSATSGSTTSSATTTAATGFAGVMLVSTRVGFARGLIALTLRCPAATVGRCSGKTKLTARRRATSSSIATTVILGRATFAIAAGEQGKVKVRVSRAGRRLLNYVPRLRGKDINAARDGAGQSKTTVATVTIRRRRG